MFFSLRVKNSEFHRDEFYPGQVLVGKPSHFSGATWVEGSLEKASADPAGRNKKKARIVATVQSVEVVSLGVQVLSISSSDTEPGLSDYFFTFDR